VLMECISVRCIAPNRAAADRCDSCERTGRMLLPALSPCAASGVHYARGFPVNYLAIEARPLLRKVYVYLLLSKAPHAEHARGRSDETRGRSDETRGFVECSPCGSC